MKILVTGGAGFIGSNLALKLKGSGDHVAVIDNLDPYYQLKLKKFNLAKLKKNNIIFNKIDIRDSGKVLEFSKQFKPNIIIHLAAKAGVRNSLLYPDEYFSVNVQGTLNILEAARAVKVEKLMIASSSSVYGNNEKVPFSEDDLTEDQISPYAASKKAMETLIKMYSSTYGLNTQIFRFFTVYGPSGRPDMAPAIFTKAIEHGQHLTIFGGLETSRDYTFIEDIIEGLTQALSLNERFNIYNLGNNKTVRLKEFIEAIEKASSKKAKVKITGKRQGDVEITWADIEKAKKNFGYSPKTSIQEGMKKFVNWFKDSSYLYD